MHFKGIFQSSKEKKTDSWQRSKLEEDRKVLEDEEIAVQIKRLKRGTVRGSDELGNRGLHAK